MRSRGAYRKFGMATEGWGARRCWRGPELQRTGRPRKAVHVAALERDFGADGPSLVDQHPSFLAGPFAVALHSTDHFRALE